MNDLCAYLCNSLGWSAVWLILGYVVMSAYITRGNL